MDKLTKEVRGRLRVSCHLRRANGHLAVKLVKCACIVCSVSDCARSLLLLREPLSTPFALLASLEGGKIVLHWAVEVLAPPPRNASEYLDRGSFLSSVTWLLRDTENAPLASPSRAAIELR